MARFKVTQTANRERAEEVFQRLAQTYPDARCSLDYSTPLELLVATILAAQCTDERVNIVTKDLFARYRAPEDYVGVSQEELGEDIRTCGFFNQKAKSIQKACQVIIEQHGGEVPGTLEELVRLPGVGRKTANVLLGECFETPGVVVDTHCARVSKRLGFTKETDATKIERDLMKIWPQEQWTRYSHLLVFHGRSVCAARAPRCSDCVVRDLCPFPETREGKKIAR
jgi:endonuclease-3